MIRSAFRKDMAEEIFYTYDDCVNQTLILWHSRVETMAMQNDDSAHAPDSGCGCACPAGRGVSLAPMSRGQNR